MKKENQMLALGSTKNYYLENWNEIFWVKWCLWDLRSVAALSEVLITIKWLWAGDAGKCYWFYLKSIDKMEVNTSLPSKVK